MNSKDRGLSKDIFSQEWAPRWRAVDTSIWTLDQDGLAVDASRTLLRTLFDQPRWIPPRFLYDERGSRLFEKISVLPEYYLTRTEEEILETAAPEIIAQAPVECIVELGAGFSRKTVHLLREQVKQRQGGTFAPIDVSINGLMGSRDALRKQFPDLSFHGLLGRYEEGIASIRRRIPTLFTFLGSSIGNFDQSNLERFLHLLTGSMGPEDFLLLGVDCLKEVHVLQAAYDDAQGITREFIFNAFEHVNRILRSDFDTGKMEYQPAFNDKLRRMEMFVAPTSEQEVYLGGAGRSLVWRPEDPILVEISRKFDPHRLEQQLRFFSLEPRARFSDSRNWFSLLLFQKAEHTDA